MASPQGVAQRASAALWRPRREHFRAFLARHPDGYAYLHSQFERPNRIKNDFVRVRDWRVVEHHCTEWRNVEEWGNENVRPVADASSCHPPTTVEEHYRRCAELIARSASGVVIELHENGVLAACALPGAHCGPTSTDCLTIRWLWDPEAERPCVQAFSLLAPVTGPGRPSRDAPTDSSAQSAATAGGNTSS